MKRLISDMHLTLGFQLTKIQLVSSSRVMLSSAKSIGF